ncbi:MAG: fimbrillin family protein [Odoribacteraceae bacterium]|jgi:hypothetical protein|nr:fimbrillin family protein [Odoribacteraceae bacterium]
MKQTFILLLGLVVLAGCSKNDKANDSDLALIQLGAGVGTRAPIVAGTFTAGIAGWEDVSAANYSNAPLWSTTITPTVTPLAADVTWTQHQYYNTTTTIKTFMKAWHPAGTLTGTSVAFSNPVGDVDVLFAPEISGYKGIPDPKPNLAFDHKTAQILFEVIAGQGLAANTRIKSITINNVQLPNGINLATDEVNFAAAAPLPISNILKAGQTEYPLITDVKTQVGDPVMIKPLTSNKFEISVVTSTAGVEDAARTAEVTVTTPAGVLIGTAYTVSLTFGPVGIELTATVTPWQTATGSAEIL